MAGVPTPPAREGGAARRNRFGGRRIAVLTPRIGKRRWYHFLMHAHRTDNLRAELLKSGTDVTLIETSWNADL